jgi:hypothetical protein
MTSDEASGMLVWLDECALMLTDAGFAADIHNKPGSIGLVVSTPAGRREWTFFVTMVGAGHVQRELRIHAGRLNIVLPARI